jgi:hypothetical protein
LIRFLCFNGPRIRIHRREPRIHLTEYDFCQKIATLPKTYSVLCLTIGPIRKNTVSIRIKTDFRHVFTELGKYRDEKYRRGERGERDVRGAREGGGHEGVLHEG